jgi:excisionase family DNA binding protein
MPKDTQSGKEIAGERVAGRTGKTVETFPRLMAVDDVAAMLNCSTRTVWRFSDAGKFLRPLKLGSLRRWRREDVDQWLADGCPSVRGGA